ncbi:MAG: methyltransferase [Alphaproteobacteria bacterium]|jgi:ubiquinone/menaquinone biosynthesis C-methylase UbiE|nr:methyltransferase [Alphaproteobacteria bacterium]
MPEQPADQASHRRAQLYDEILFSAAMRGFYGDDYYNVGLWAETTGGAAEACAALVSRVAGEVHAPPQRILDAGCGVGGSTRAIARCWPEAEIVGIGISERQLEHARAVCPTATFTLMDAAAMTFADASFDAVIAIESALHFDTRERFFARAARILRPGGSIALADLLVPSRHWPGAWNVPADNLGWATVARYAEALQGAGFSDIKACDVTTRTWDAYLTRFSAHVETLASDDTANMSWRASARALREAEPPCYVLASARIPTA